MESGEDKNFYELLGVGRSATVDEIKTAYHDIARVYHPDSNFFDEILESVPEVSESALSDQDRELFQQLTEAYTTLKNEKRRNLYDKKLKAAENPSVVIAPPPQAPRPSPKPQTPATPMKPKQENCDVKEGDGPATAAISREEITQRPGGLLVLSGFIALLVVMLAIGFIL
jgi:curved DNA-binding protein CbpA